MTFSLKSGVGYKNSLTWRRFNSMFGDGSIRFWRSQNPGGIIVAWLMYSSIPSHKSCTDFALYATREKTYEYLASFIIIILINCYSLALISRCMRLVRKPTNIWCRLFLIILINCYSIALISRYMRLVRKP